ncbi:UDP-N-acetylglucosamine 2-epimerase [Candidatus Nitrosotenuis chungbukensis]|uniref:UDP-N-acetylglucosamine 2-epimerase n=1 Tax=Candidatus Nitrosotenuis chungbukensis TaxID=1353246 RepID=UPI000694B416|nr:UDP-N-acetylglucosamine 2-epimerase [Candidatus Nitrosotenuis chungbukensis]WKT58292.1 UDP-N-acetylglucosamine 2-epimerase [Candidatus Nitrosotenuis chungbukensis]
MIKRKIVVTTGTRADYGLLRPILRAILANKKLELHLIVTGSHLSRKFGLTIREIKKDGFIIAAKIPMIPQKDTNYDVTISLGKGIIAFSKVFRRLRPDVNLILGDRDEMLASALAAYHMNIPNAHIHGGDKSGGIDEYTRHAITKISNIHFAATQKSMNRIIKMGENPKYVFLTGSSSLDEIIQNNITSKKDLEKKYHVNFNKDVILLLQHPVTTETNLSTKQIINTLDALVEINKQVVAISPNSDAGNSAIFTNLTKYANRYGLIKNVTSMPRCDYLGMLKNCVMLVGNSSSGIIEASFLDTPVVNIGIRQKNRERLHNVIDVDDDKFAIIDGINKALKMTKRKLGHKTQVYGSGNASTKIVQHLEKISLNKQLIQKQISY